MNDFIEVFIIALNEKDYIYLEPMNKSGGWVDIFYIYSNEPKKKRVVMKHL